mmetsp:Transcript_46555/g.144252  ORF Transcript_46555/g.144252 Transcript_46555/m.144252 type:complete len:218 (+) Transcript_46555:877-1530(+)
MSRVSTWQTSMPFEKRKKSWAPRSRTRPRLALARATCWRLRSDERRSTTQSRTSKARFVSSVESGRSAQRRRMPATSTSRSPPAACPSRWREAAPSRSTPSSRPARRKRCSRTAVTSCSPRWTATTSRCLPTGRQAPGRPSPCTARRGWRARRLGRSRRSTAWPRRGQSASSTRCAAPCWSCTGTTLWTCSTRDRLAPPSPSSTFAWRSPARSPWRG